MIIVHFATVKRRLHKEKSFFQGYIKMKDKLKKSFPFQIRRKRLARLGGSDQPASPPEPQKPIEEPAPMEEDESQRIRSQSSVRQQKFSSNQKCKQK